MKKSVGAATLIYPTPVLVVGTYDADGNPNIMTVAWGGVCCSRPPAVSIALRKATYSFQNIVDRKAFTVNIPPESSVREVDYLGIYSGRNEDKFSSCGLTPVKSDLIDAPYVEEFPLVLECRLIHTVEIGLHTQFIGEVLDAKADDSVLDEDGNPDIEKIKPFVYAPVGRTYFSVGAFLGKAFAIGRKEKGD